jgi:hypothetical protein
VTSTITDEVNGSTTEDRNKPTNEMMIDMTMTPTTTVVTIQILFLVAVVILEVNVLLSPSLK